MRVKHKCGPKRNGVLQGKKTEMFCARCGTDICVDCSKTIVIPDASEAVGVAFRDLCIPCANLGTIFREEK